MQADEYLQQGDFDKAILMLHFAKATKNIPGDQDVSLGKGYLAKGEVCIAKEYFVSGLSFMQKNKLTELPMYPSTIKLYEQAAQDCAKRSQPR